MSHYPSRWTVMVFMGADGVEGNKPLGQEARDDIAEMRRIGSNDDLKIFVQVHGDGPIPARHYIGKTADEGVPVPPGEQDPTGGRALRDFIRWSLDQANRDPNGNPLPEYEDRYSLLVLWGHAYRFGIGPRETRAGIDALDFQELASVLSDLQEDLKGKYGLAAKPKLDVIGFDACDLASIEMAFQLERFADYLIASQIGVPLPGWPYHRILDRLRNPQGDRAMGPAELGVYTVRRYCEEYEAQGRPVSLTMLDLKRVPDLVARTELLALRLARAMADDPDEQRLVYNLFLRARTDNDSPFVDVADLCLNLIRNCTDPFVTHAATELGDLLVSSPRPPAPGGSGAGAKRPFIVEHGRVGAQTANLHGVSLYAPHVAEEHAAEAARYWYKKFVFARETSWSGVVHALAQPHSFEESALLGR